MKCTFEIPNGSKQWRTFRVTYCYSRNGNCTAKHNNEVYVWKAMREGEAVLKLVGKKWVKVGRVSFGTVFIGKTDELSYAEYSRTPEAVEASRRVLQSFYKSKAEAILS